MDSLINNVLIIDLSKHSFYVEKREDLFNEYLGGAGVGIQLLNEFLDPGAEPLSPDNVIIFSVGILTGKFPMASKTVALFKSPQNGYLGESHAGGRSAIAIWQAGYGAIVIKGASPTPVYVVIDGGDIYFRDARSIWGVSDMAVAGRIMRERDGNSGLRSIMRIGSAGEKLVAFSSLTTETYRHFGRLGLGAVFGSKRLKGLVVTGSRGVSVENGKAYRALYDELYDSCISNSTRKYHELGTAGNLLSLNELSALPTRNFKETSFEKAEELSGENLAKAHLGRRVACSHCPVGCIHLAMLRESYPDDPYFYKTSFVCYDYEPLYSVGTLLGIQSVEDFLKIMIAVEKYGVDVITVGVILAWITEAFEKGLIGREETGNISPACGDAVNYIELIEKMMKSKNEFFNLMCRGLDALTNRYGGKEFAVNYFGNELSGYHTGPGIHLTHITGARHSHLDSAGYNIDQKMLRQGTLLSSKELAAQLFNEESERQVLTSLVVCLFARNVYTMNMISKCLKISGMDFSENRLRETGKKILVDKNILKRKMGFDIEKFTIPERILSVPTPSGKIDPSYLREAVKHFKDLIDL